MAALTYPVTDRNLIYTMADRLKKAVKHNDIKNLLYYLSKSSGSMVKIYDRLEIPMYPYGPPSTGKWIGIQDNLPDPQPSRMEMGYATNRYIAVPTGFNELEQWIFEGHPQKFFDKWDIETMEAAWAMRRAIGYALWNGSGGKQPDGIASVIEKALPAAQTATVTGFSKATNAWMRNQYVQLNSNFGFVAAGSQVPAGFLATEALWNACVSGRSTPTDLVTTKDIFNLFRRAFSEFSTAYHMITKREHASYGFRSFDFNGSALSWDDGCPSDSIYALRMNDSARGSAKEYFGTDKDKAIRDMDFEDIAGTSMIDVDGSLAISGHPNVQNRTTGTRSGRRTLVQAKWMITSVNWCYKRLNDQGVAGSDNGSRWSTW